MGLGRYDYMGGTTKRSTKTDARYNITYTSFCYQMQDRWNHHVASPLATTYLASSGVTTCTLADTFEESVEPTSFTSPVGSIRISASVDDNFCPAADLSSLLVSCALLLRVYFCSVLCACCMYCSTLEFSFDCLSPSTVLTAFSYARRRSFRTTLIRAIDLRHW